MILAATVPQVNHAHPSIRRSDARTTSVAGDLGRDDDREVRRSMRVIRTAIGATTINPKLLTCAERLQV
jgi:hypothetical protein